MPASSSTPLSIFARGEDPRCTCQKACGCNTIHRLETYSQRAWVVRLDPAGTRAHERLACNALPVLPLHDKRDAMLPTTIKTRLLSLSHRSKGRVCGAQGGEGQS